MCGANKVKTDNVLYIISGIELGIGGVITQKLNSRVYREKLLFPLSPNFWNNSIMFYYKRQCFIKIKLKTRIRP